MFFILCFTVSVTPSSNTAKSSNDSTILIISFMSSSEINKAKFFPAVTAPFPLIFLSNLFIVFEVKWLTYPGRLSLIKGIVMFVSAFFPKLLNQEPKNTPD